MFLQSVLTIVAVFQLVQPTPIAVFKPQPLQVSAGVLQPTLTVSSYQPANVNLQVTANGLQNTISASELQ